MKDIKISDTINLMVFIYYTVEASFFKEKRTTFPSFILISFLCPSAWKSLISNTTLSFLPLNSSGVSVPRRRNLTQWPPVRTHTVSPSDTFLITYSIPSLLGIGISLIVLFISTQHYFCSRFLINQFQIALATALITAILPGLPNPSILILVIL